jgi:uncharacterized protein YjbK
MEIEIEFKNHLTKQQYEHLLRAFHVQPSQIKRQTNHYFDTVDGQIKQLKAALRIRETAEYMECTLKEAKTENRSNETTDSLTKQQSEEIQTANRFPSGAVLNRLIALEIDPATLSLFGTLTTDRVELPYKGGTLVFDHSFYLQQDDYEVEYETADELQGLPIFEAFLEEHQIDKRVTDKKIARFMKALQQKGL